MKHFTAIPNSQLPITPLEEMDAPPCKKPASILTPKEEADVDNMLASVFSNGDYGMDDLDEESVNKAVYDLANNVDGLYDIVGIYANNQKSITDKLNMLIKQDQQVIGAQISLQERVRSLETLNEQKKFPMEYVLLALTIIAIALGVVGVIV